MLNQAIKAIDTEVVIFNSSENAGDVDAFQNDVNSWLRGQPDNVVIEDIIYRHSGLTSKGKDVCSIAIISRSIKSTK